MPRFRRLLILSALLLAFGVTPCLAQYMKITTDNPADPGRLRPSGTTILTITLDTNHHRDGSLQTCNSHTIAAGCAPPASSEPLDLGSYTITLSAIGGTVSWGTFTAADPNFVPIGDDLVNGTQIEINRFSSPFTPPGLITLGSIPVTLVSGAPRIEIAHGTQAIDPFGFGTGFGVHCDAFQFPNTYLLGDPAFVCSSGDWFDVDGVAAPTTPPTCPVAVPGGPYEGLVNVPLTFDGTASVDPDGTGLSYSWDFDASDGIGVDATGPTPSHTYAVSNSYLVTLTVTDDARTCSNSATTLAIVNVACNSTVFNGYEPIRLSSNRAWFAFVQPASGCYTNADVDLGSFVLSFSDVLGQVHADPKKTTLDRDHNGDGISEIRVSFPADAIQSLFGNRPGGTYLAVIHGRLVNGAGIGGVHYVDVVRGGSGSFSAATIAPNPLNPAATVSFETSRTGFVRIDMFDIQGRLVRRLVDDPAMSAGAHEAVIDGRGAHGEALSSGVYYVRGVSSEGTFKRLVTILK